MIGIAYAQDAAATASGPMGALTQFLPLIFMFAVVWFIMIRPQMKRAKEHKALVAALQKGDEVITQGGVAGRISKVGDNYVSLSIAEGKDGPVEMMVQKPAIQVVLPKGTLKSL